MAADAIWTAIAATLRDDIAAGRFRPGDRLPSETALAQRFGVNRHTLRRAVAQLADEGVLRTRRGAGVFVVTPPADYPLGRRVRFHQNLTAAGRVPGRQILSLLTRAADPAESAALRLNPGDPVHVCEGVSLADGQPLSIFCSRFPAARLPDLPAYLRAEGSVTLALARHGVTDYTRASTRLNAVAADAAQAAHLWTVPGAPLMLAVAINVDGAGVPVEYGTTWFAGDRVTLTVGDDQAP